MRTIGLSKSLTIPLNTFLVNRVTASRPLQGRSFRAMSTASEQKTAEDASASSAPKQRKLVIFGGNGYVGQAMIREALRRENVNVISINRSGKPKNYAPSVNSKGSIDWVMGDALNGSTYRDVLHGADGAISCVGAFGTNEFMEKVNGDANIQAISECLKGEVPRFVYISTVENNLPSFVLSGYFNGKRRTEEALRDAYPDTGAILRPGFIHGTREVQLPVSGATVGIPLSIVGKPLEFLLSCPPAKLARDNIPGMKAILAPPIAVETLARTAVSAALGSLSYPVQSDRVLSIEDIKKAAVKE